MYTFFTYVITDFLHSRSASIFYSDAGVHSAQQREICCIRIF